MFRTLLTLLGSLALCGCASLDHFTDRAIDFNAQVANVQDSTLLLNVLRAAHRKPMHFTELSTLSGTSQLNSSLTLGFPFGPFRGPPGSWDTSSTNISGSQSPTFNIAVLETQEFYKGVLGQLTPDQAYMFIREGLPPAVVFKLFFGGLVYQDASMPAADVVENNFHPRKDRETCDASLECSEYARFDDVLKVLLDRGLTLERVQNLVDVGPSLDPAKLDAKALNDLTAQGLLVVAENKRIQVKRAESAVRPCFHDDKKKKPVAPNGAKFVELDVLRTMTLPLDSKCGNGKPADAKTKEPESEQRLWTIPLLGIPAVIPATENKFKHDQAPTKPATLQLVPRSTEGVIYYLGEITRCELELDPSRSCRKTKPTVDTEYQIGSTLFTLSHDKRPDPSMTKDAHTIHVNFDGESYSLPVDPTGKDRSAQVLRVLNQLLALNRSAKDFPAPATIPLLSH